MDYQQKSKCEEFLNMIPPEQLLQLAGAITKLELPSANDAVKYILSHTKTPKELLERQQVKKKYLKDYILKKMKPVPKDAKKDKLVEIILDMWKPYMNVSPIRVFGMPDPAVAIPEPVVHKRKEDSPLQKPGKKQKVSASSPGIRLNKEDKANCKALLMVIPEHEILSMAETISKIKYTSKKDAISNILMFTKTPRELLEKKSIQKSFLTLYLLQKKKQYPGNAKKEELVEIILNMWSANPKPPAVDPNTPGASGFTPANVPTPAKPTLSMNEKQKSKCKQLLTLMPKADLLSLANTMAKREFSIESDAISAILMIAKSQRELLEKQKMKSELLESYLIKKGILRPASAKKPQLVDDILKLWNPDKSKDVQSGSSGVKQE